MISNVYSILLLIGVSQAQLPLVINTWAFTTAAENAWSKLQENNSSLDALEEGCRTCQTAQCDFTVGYGGSPDENGESTLDALIFDGNTMNMGAVGGIRNVKDAIGVARRVLENTEHSFLVGSLAGDFAHSLGYTNESLETNYSKGLYESWKEDKCQPNFWTNVLPDPSENCGPYTLPTTSRCSLLRRRKNHLLTNEIPQDNTIELFNSQNHDTIGMIVINSDGHVVAGTSTNGANHKIPGRVGDSPIVGAGAYADSEIGAATGTGDGDVMMRFLPSFLAVERMRLGDNPTQAAQVAIDRIAAKYPSFFGGVIAVSKNGTYGAACNGMETFPYSVRTSSMSEVTVEYATCA